MAHSCGPTVFTFVAHIHQTAVVFWLMCGGRTAPALPSVSYACYSRSQAGQLAIGYLEGSQSTFSRFLTRALLRKSSASFFSLGVMTVVPVGGSYGLGRAIVESKAVD